MLYCSPNPPYLYRVSAGQLSSAQLRVGLTCIFIWNSMGNNMSTITMPEGHPLPDNSLEPNEVHVEAVAEACVENNVDIADVEDTVDANENNASAAGVESNENNASGAAAEANNVVIIDDVSTSLETLEDNENNGNNASGADAEDTVDANENNASGAAAEDSEDNENNASGADAEDTKDNENNASDVDSEDAEDNENNASDADAETNSKRVVVIDDVSTSLAMPVATVPKRPRGAAPKGKTWDYEKGVWVEVHESHSSKKRKLSRKDDKRSRKRSRKDDKRSRKRARKDDKRARKDDKRSRKADKCSRKADKLSRKRGNPSAENLMKMALEASPLTLSQVLVGSLKAFIVDTVRDEFELV